MSGVQCHEAQIDDQLLPVGACVELLGRHGCRDVDTLWLRPMHAVVFGRT